MKGEKLSMFALVFAAVVLLVVGAVSYNNYVRQKYEKEFAQRAQQAGIDPAAPAATPAPAQPAPAQPAAPQPAVNPAAPSPVAAAPAPAPQTDLQVSPPPVPQTGAAPPAHANPAPTPAPPAVSPGADSSVARLQADLEMLKQENALYQQKLNEVRGGSDKRTAMRFNSQGDGVATGSVPASAVTAAAGGAAPASGPAQDFAAIAEKIRKASPIAKVIDYDPDWALVIIDGGQDRNIEEGMRFAVRRGGEILGWIKITDVDGTTSGGELTTANKFSQTARKPQAGDDIIPDNLF
ncbi:MAG: hypothetical protein H7A52_16530 [Akkermansiaceae bacterium]|nr:hypothetical protein [Akkermansiaceae bacterium]